MEIQVGKKYVRRDGKVVEIVKNDGHPTHPYVSDAKDDYTNDGEFYNQGGTHGCDLIREYVEEPEGKTLAELDVKPGDVVDWIENGTKHTIISAEVITEGMYVGEVQANLSDYGTGIFGMERFRIISRATPTEPTPTLTPSTNPDDVIDAMIEIAEAAGYNIDEIRMTTEGGASIRWPATPH